MTIPFPAFAMCLCLLGPPALRAQAEPVDAHLLTVAARAKMDTGDTAAARSLLEQALAASPNSPEANLALGRLLLDEAHYPEAMDRFETVLSTDRRAGEARRGELDAATRLALESKRAGNQQAALLCLQHARGALPDEPVLLRNLGIQAFDMRLLAVASEALNAALAIDPADLQALYALARVEIEQGKPELAGKHLEAYLKARPDDATAHYGLGHLLQTQLRNDEAAAEFRRSIELKPLQTESYYQLGQMALDEHHDDEAAPLFEKALARSPGHGGALTGLGILQYRAKQYERAAERLKLAVAASPAYAPAHYYLGLTLGRLGDKEGSARELAEAADLTAKQQDKGKPLAPGTIE